MNSDLNANHNEQSSGDVADDDFIVDLGSDEDYIYVDHTNDEENMEDSNPIDDVGGEVKSPGEGDELPVVEVNPVKNILFRNSKPNNPYGINNSKLSDTIRGSSRINPSKEEIKHVKGEIIEEDIIGNVDVPTGDNVVDAEIINGYSSENKDYPDLDVNIEDTTEFQSDKHVVFDSHLKNNTRNDDFTSIIDETFNNNPDGNLDDEDISYIASALVDKAFDNVISDTFNKNNDEFNESFSNNVMNNEDKIQNNNVVNNNLEKRSHESIPDGVTYYEGVNDIQSPLRKNNLYYDGKSSENKSVKESIKSSIRDIKYIHKSLNEIENPTPIGYVSVVDRTIDYDTPSHNEENVSYKKDFVLSRNDEIKDKNKSELDNIIDEFNNDDEIRETKMDDDLESIIQIADEDYKEIEKERFKKNNKLKSFDDNKLPKKGNIGDEIVNYRFADNFGLNSQEDLFNQPIDDVSKSINEIIRVEGPIHVNEVIKRVKDSCNIKRAGANMKKQVNKAIKNSENSGDIIKIGNFLYDSSVNDVVIRKRVKPKIDLISDEEIAKNIKTTLKHRRVLSTNLLIREVSRNFGFKSTSRKTSTKIKSVLDSLIADSTVKLNDDTVELN